MNLPGPAEGGGGRGGGEEEKEGMLLLSLEIGAAGLQSEVRYPSFSIIFRTYLVKELWRVQLRMLPVYASSTLSHGNCNVAQ